MKEDKKHGIALCYFSWMCTINPIFVWQAIYLCRYYNMKYPLWIKQYLDRISRSIILIQPSGETTDQSPAQQAYAALEFSEPRGERSAFTNAKLQVKKVRALFLVTELHKNKPLRDNKNGPGAFSMAANELNVSESRVCKWYYELKPLWEELEMGMKYENILKIANINDNDLDDSFIDYYDYENLP